MCFSMKMASKAAKKHQLKWQQRKKKKVNTLVAKIEELKSRKAKEEFASSASVSQKVTYYL